MRRLTQLYRHRKLVKTDAQPLQLYSSLSRQKEAFSPLRPPEVGMYTCGPTVYNYAHIGNFRAYVAADVLRRWLQVGHGHLVKWVMNITDVDDKTIAASAAAHPELEPKEALLKFTRHFEAIFFEDMAALGIKQSVFYKNPRATEAIPEMLRLCQSLLDGGHAYQTTDGLFFDVQKYGKQQTYGQLVDIAENALRTGGRTLRDEIEKEDVADFALWKAKKDGEPAWEGDVCGQHVCGRPGWHLECSAMAKEALGLPFDIHTGGVDLRFPHHEDEIAQNAAGYGAQTARFWVHNEHLLVDGKKMSKSAGNFFTLRDLLKKGHSADAVRYFLATGHYRQKINLREDALAGCAKALAALREVGGRAANAHGDGGQLRDALTNACQAAWANFSAAMNADLNAPRAIAALHELRGKLSPMGELSAEEGQQVAQVLKKAGEVLGLDFFPQEAAAATLSIPAQIIEKCRQRDAARAQKDFARADALRAEIEAAGFELRDGKEGSVAVRKE